MEVGGKEVFSSRGTHTKKEIRSEFEIPPDNERRDGQAN